jgi:hypothetical protein
MSGAADDWAYEHLGVYAWTTEFWDVVLAATGEKQASDFWYVGPTDAQALAVLRWVDEHAPDQHIDWYPFDHPQLGPVELGGWHHLGIWTNPPLDRLRDEVTPHARFAVAQAMAAPCLEIVHTAARDLGGGTWRVEAGIANTGWLPTTVSARGAKDDLAKPVVAEVAGAEVIGGPARVQLGQLGGRAGMRFSQWHDGTPDRLLATWIVVAAAGTELTVTAAHDRAGRSEVTLRLDT